MYGANRIGGQLVNPPAEVRQLGERVVGDVHRFMGNHPQSDDMCLVGWGRLDKNATPARPPGPQATLKLEVQE
jgi:hypothetical protein